MQSLKGGNTDDTETKTKSKFSFKSKEFILSFQMFITFAFFIVELAVGYGFKSLALQADAYHMLSDLLSLIIAFAALRVGKRSLVSKAGKIPNTYGWARADVIGGLVNAVFLIAICVTIAIEAIIRFASPEMIERPAFVLTVACIGFLINLIGIGLFHNHAFGHKEHSHSHKVEDNLIIDRNNNITLDINNTEINNTDDDENVEGHLNENDDDDVNNDNSKNKKKSKKRTGGSLNFKGTYMHILGDLLGSIIVMVNTSIILIVRQDWTKYLDPSLSLISVIILLYGSIPIVKKSCSILAQTVPPGLDVNAFKSSLQEAFPDVIGIHEFHIWLLTSDRIIASLHLLFRNHERYHNNLEAIKAFFHDYNIHSVTIQPEFVSYEDDNTSVENLILSEERCNFVCPGSDCNSKKCC